jgi:GalNAc5-diNAcBac-PP-undecaprenol beta-1,3-glucosyltransferase
MPRVVVLVPTFDHGPTLRPAIHMALNQTEQDLAVHVIGDGAPVSTDRLMDEITTVQPRVRYHPNPKSPRTGEPYRHELLQSVDAEIVCYLSDDDIWMPDHVEVLSGALRHHDLAATLSVSLQGGRMRVSRMQWSDAADRALSCRQSRVSLTETGHRLDAYLRLPFGWRSTPPGRYTDHYMWEQWLREPWVRAVTVTRWTQLHIPAALRHNVAGDGRAAEQWAWWHRFRQPDWDRERAELLIDGLRYEYERVDRSWQGLEARVADLVRTEQLLAEADARCAAMDAELSQLRATVARMSSSRTWRVGQRLARVSGYQAWKARSLR